MKKQLIIIPFLLLTLLPALLFAQKIVEKNGFYNAEVSETFNIGSGGSISVKGISGEVDFQGWKSDKVEVREVLYLNVFTKEEAEKILERTETEISTSGNHIRISGHGKRHYIRRKLEIKLPEKFDVDARVTNGRIHLRGVTGSIILQSSNGAIELTDCGGDVEAHTSSGDLYMDNVKGRLDARTSGGNIRLRNVTERADLQTSGGSISVIGAEKDVFLFTSGGEITTRDIGGNLDARTSGGDIDVIDCKGNADLQTSGGDIEVENIGGTLDANTSGGDVSGKRINDRTSARTSGGDIDLIDVNGAVNARTSAGDIDVEISMTDFSKDHRMFLSTRSGGIHLFLPEKMPATITAEIRNNSRWKRYEINSDFPLQESTENRERVLRKTGDINGGGDEIRLETSGGDISIRKNR